MRAIKYQDDQNFYREGRVQVFDNHDVLLLSTEKNYDDQFTSSSDRILRKVHSTELGDSTFELDSTSEAISEHKKWSYPSLNSISNTLITSSARILKS